MNHAEAEILTDKIMAIVMDGSVFYQAGIDDIRHKILQLITEPDLETAEYCKVCHNKHRRSDIVMIGDTRLIPNHEYIIVTKTTQQRYPRSWRMGFIGTNQAPPRNLQFSARGPDRTHSNQYGGTVVLDARTVIRVHEVERIDAERHVGIIMDGKSR